MALDDTRIAISDTVGAALTGRVGTADIEILLVVAS